SEQRDSQGDGGSRGARDDRRCRPPGRRVQVDRFARSRRKLPRCVREERLAGYKLALEEAGISLDPSLVIETTANYSGGGTAVPQLLNLPDPATAALCFNDVVAIGLTRALMEAGVSVGVDFDVIGFDDIE